LWISIYTGAEHGDSGHPCDICDFASASATDLNAHKKSSHGDDEIPEFWSRESIEDDNVNTFNYSLDVEDIENFNFWFWTRC